MGSRANGTARSTPIAVPLLARYVLAPDPAPTKTWRLPVTTGRARHWPGPVSSGSAVPAIMSQSRVPRTLHRCGRHMKIAPVRRSKAEARAPMAGVAAATSAWRAALNATHVR